MAVEGHSDSFG